MQECLTFTHIEMRAILLHVRCIDIFVIGKKNFLHITPYLDKYLSIVGGILAASATGGRAINKRHDKKNTRRCVLPIRTPSINQPLSFQDTHPLNTMILLYILLTGLSPKGRALLAAHKRLPRKQNYSPLCDLSEKIPAKHSTN